MKTKISLFIFLFYASICHAKYDPLMISQLIDNSNLIGYGEVIEVSENQILFKFHGFIKGTSKVNVLRINKFKDWTCAKRYTKYKIGQKELLFLKYTKNMPCEILGSGNEGEMPILLENLYYKSPYQYFEKSATIYKLNGGELSGYLFSFPVVQTGIKEYLSNRNLYHLIGKDKSKKSKEFKNPFLKRLVFELRTQIYMTE